MTVLDAFDFDAFAEGAPVSTSSPWNTQGAGLNAFAASAMHGTRGAQATEVTGNAAVYHLSAQHTDTRVMSQYFRLVNLPGRVYLGGVTSSGAQRADWRVNADGTVSIRNGYVAIATSLETLTTGTWYRSEWMISPTGQELRIYLGESATPHLTLVGALTDNSHTTLVFGVFSGAQGHTLDLDTIRVADDWVGPLVTEDATPHWYYDNGTEWVDVSGALHYDNGTAWVPVAVTL